jgi:B12-binding domain/radical SAM domain protein
MTRPLVLFNYQKTAVYSLHALAGALEAAGLDAAAELAFAKTTEALAARLAEAAAGGRPVLVCWSFMSPAFAAAAGLLRRLKAAADGPGVRHVAGGAHPTAEPEETLRAGFDLAAVGEGEHTIVAAVRRLVDGADLRGLAGLAWLEDGRFVSGGPGRRVDLEAFPPFAPRAGRFNAIEITRGCVYACRFCQTPFLYKARFRHRSPATVHRYAREMFAAGYKDMRFVTPTSLSYGAEGGEVRLDRVAELLAGVRAVVGGRGRIFFGTFPSELRPEHVTPEAVRLLRRYVDNDNLVVGAQSAAAAVLEASHRGHGAEVIEPAVRYILEGGFKAYVEFIFGLPGEGRAEALASLALAERLAELGARVHGHTFMPLPGTPFAGAPAGRIDPDIRLRLQRLASRGGLFGQWERQEPIARELAARAAARAAAGGRPPRGVAARLAARQAAGA